MSKIAFMTLGCKVNQADTASMQMLFREAGYEVCDFNEIADVYLVNTCVVTNAGQQKSRQMIRRAIRRNPAHLWWWPAVIRRRRQRKLRRFRGLTS